METYPASHEPFPTNPGLHIIDPRVHSAELFALDCAFAYDNDNLIAFESQEELVHFLTEEHRSDTYVLNDEHGKPVGSISLVPTSDSTIEVLSVGVIPEAQSRGFGAHMMQFAEDAALLAGKSAIHLVAKQQNVRALTFYERLGYVQKGLVENHYSDFDSDVRVRLEKRLR